MIAGAAPPAPHPTARQAAARPSPAPPTRPAPTRPAPPRPAPPRPAPPPEIVFHGLGPLAWNAAVSRDRNGGGIPGWPAVHVLGPFGTESLFVFPPRAPAPMLLASWPRQEPAAHSVRIFPGYRWIVVEKSVEFDTPAAASLAAEADAPNPRGVLFYTPSGSLRWEAQVGSVPAALGRDFVLASRASAIESVPPRLSVVRLPGEDALASWPGLEGWGASSSLENFMAVNTIGLVDSVTGQRQDELRLLDLEGKILWARTVSADAREFAVSNFGDVAIAREKQLLVIDRSGSEKLRVALPRNSSGNTAITPDGRYALVATTSPLARRKGTGPWIALYDTARKAPVWSRRTLALDAAKGADVLELSLSDDGQRALVRLTTGPVLLLGNDGRRLAAWDLERVSRGEYLPGFVPRRTWLSGDGTLISFTMPVARSLPEARGWLYRVPR